MVHLKMPVSQTCTEFRLSLSHENILTWISANIYYYTGRRHLTRSLTLKTAFTSALQSDGGTAEVQLGMNR